DGPFVAREVGIDHQRVSRADESVELDDRVLVRARVIVAGELAERIASWVHRGDGGQVSIRGHDDLKTAGRWRGPRDLRVTAASSPRARVNVVAAALAFEIVPVNDTDASAHLNVASRTRCTLTVVQPA